MSSDDVTEAMEVAKDAGFADDVLEAADSILTKKLLLQDIAVAMRSEDAGRVQALCAMAGHAGLLSARLKLAKAFLKRESALDAAATAIYNSRGLNDWSAALSAARACGVDDAVTKLAEGVGLIACRQ